MTVLLSPVVALSATVFTVPVVTPTPLFTPPVTAFDAEPTTPGFLGVVAGVAFFTAVGVGFVPSALTAGFIGVFLTVVAFVVVEVVFVAVFAGLAFVVFILGAELAWFLIFGPLTTGIDAVDAGVVFFAEAGVLVAGFDTSLAVLLAATGVFFAGFALEGSEVEGTVFFAAVGAVGFTGVLFAGLGVVCDAGVDVLVSFAGAFRTGVGVVPVGFVAAGAVFLTGVTAFCVAEEVVLVAEEGAFFAVEEPPCATF